MFSAIKEVGENDSLKDKIHNTFVLPGIGHDDDEFNTHCKMCSKIFHVPVAAIATVDEQSIWFRSQIGLTNLKEISRNDSISRSLFEHGPIVVIEDAFANPSTRNSVFIQRFNIHFIAAAQIVIEDAPIGYLLIADFAPKSNFSSDHKQILLDICKTVTQLIVAKREAQNISRGRNQMIMALAHHLRTPLTSLIMAVDILETDIKNKSLSYEGNTITSPSETEHSRSDTLRTGLDRSMHDVHKAIAQLGLMLETGLHMGQQLSISSPELSPRECDVLSVLSKAKGLVSSLEKCTRVLWMINERSIGPEKRRTFPEELFWLLLSSFTRLISISSEIVVNAGIGIFPRYFVCEGLKCDDVCNHEYLNVEMSVTANTAEFEDSVDELILWFGAPSQSTKTESEGEGSHKEDTSSEAARASVMSFFGTHAVLSRIGGFGKLFVEERTYRFSIPCDPAAVPRRSPRLSSPSPSPSLRERREKYVSRRPPSLVALEEIVQSVQNADLDSDSISISTEFSASEKFDKQRMSASSSTSSIANLTKDTIVVRKSVNSFHGMTKLDEELLDVSPAISSSGKVAALVIEDSISVQKILARYLASQGCTVTTANNGKEGLEILKSAGFDLVFVDFLMPVMGGIACLQAYKLWNEAQGHHDGPPYSDQLIIGMSATASMVEQQDAFAAGMHLYCPKPLDMSILSSILLAKRRTKHTVETISHPYSLNQKKTVEALLDAPMSPPMQKSLGFSSPKVGSVGHPRTRKGVLERVRSALRRIRFVAGFDA